MVTMRSCSAVRLLLAATLALFGIVPAYSTQVGNDPKFIINLDLNRDGNVDVITANYMSSNISVLLGNGKGTFKSVTEYTAGTNPTALAFGDFNGDGKADLAVGNANRNCQTCGSKSISILLGNGDGTFKPAVNYSGPSGTTWVSVADFNKDGKLDIVAAEWGADEIAVYLGNGDGTFQSPATYPTGNVPHSIAVADLDGDGKLDLAVGNQGSNSISIFFGRHDGSFTVGGTYPTGDVPHSIALGDFNHDGKYDLATADINGGTVTVVIGNGDGTFGPPTSYTTGPGSSSVVVGDFNRDGIQDLVGANSGSSSPLGGVTPQAGDPVPSNTVSVLIGNGDGTFQPAVNYVSGQGSNCVTTGDLNNDGKQDLAVGLFSGHVSVLIGNGDGTFKSPLGN